MILRTCIAIPTFNNEATILNVIQNCLTKTQLPVLVIDDGSTIPIQFHHPRVQIVRHIQNRGKGAAVQTAFRVALEHGYTHLLTMDGDGQHLASEIPVMLKEMEAHPWDLILGSRKLTGESVPNVSKFGRKFSNFWVKFQTKVEVGDSQSGFRIYPLFHVQTLKFWTRRFDFEIEVLVRMIWKDVNIRDVQTECYYPPPAERVSHFHKFWDNVHISLLNTILVAISLLRKPQSPLMAGTAFGLGAFVGVTPLYGLHTLIVAGLAFLLRLNFVYLWIGTQISLPFLVPFLVIAAVQIAKYFSLSYAMGFVILGSSLGGLAFLLVFLLTLNSRKRKSGKRAWTGNTRGGKFGNGLLKTIVKKGGLKAGYFCIYFIIPYFYVFAPTARRSLNEYWIILRPQMGFFKRQWNILVHLNCFARVLMDRMYQQFNPAPVFSIQASGLENIIEATRAAQGLVMVTAHVGGWDLAAHMLKKQGQVEEFKTVKFEAEGLTFDKVAGKANEHGKDALLGNAPENNASLIFEIRELLLKGYRVGLMGDRPLNRHYELVPFMGKLALMDLTPFRMAQLCKVPVLFTFGFKASNNKYEFYASSPRHYGKDALMTGIEDYCDALEQSLQKYPHQWFNFFPFWSSFPNETEETKDTKSSH